MNGKTKIDQWCEAVIEAGWLAALVVAPMFFNVFSSRVFEPDKISLVRSIALVMLLAWLVKLANGGRAWLPSYRGAGESGEEEVTTGAWRNPFVIPVILLITAYLISTVFSIARFVSWFGSYQRLQGTYSFLSYVIIAVLAAAHLRRPDQIRRLLHVIILTSLPIAIYGVIQHMKKDPLPWGGDVTIRIAANAGNSIFLAAYLIMAFFLTLERVYNSFAHFLSVSDSENPDQGSQEMPAAIAGGAYLFILMVQALAIFWTQSRGPWLGLLVGFYLFVLLLISGLRPKNYRVLTASWVSIGLLGIGLLVLMNTTTIFDFLRPIPYVGRLTQILDQDSTTAQVRILIWQGAADMLTPHQPLTHPDGQKDTINAIRPLVGYGPEAMWVAYNPFYPPDLAHVEARNASPDRSHNETWDSLVITGIWGFGAYMALFISIFYWALRWLGLLVNRRDNLLFALLLGGFSLALVIVFYIYDGGWRFFGVAMPAGLIAGLVLYVMIAAFLHSDFQLDRADRPRQLLIIAILTTIVAHFAEIHFGIAIAATRTYFWIETACLLALGMRWAYPEPFAWTPDVKTAAVESEEESSGVEPADAKTRRRRTQPPRPTAVRRERAADQILPVVPTMVMTDLLIFFTFVFIYTTNSLGSRNGLEILFNSISSRVVGGQPQSSWAIFLLMVFTQVICATLGLAAESLRQRRAPALSWWLTGFLVHGAIVWGGWLIYGLMQGGRLAVGAGGSTLDTQLDHVAGHFGLYTWLVVCWLFVAGTVYAWPALRARNLVVARRPAISLGAGVVIAALAFAIINSVNVALVRADIIYKQGQQFDNQRQWVSSIELYRRSLLARKTEDYYMLFLGRAFLEQAKQAPLEGAMKLSTTPTVDEVLDLKPEQVNQMGRYELLRAAEVILREAQRVNPLNTDHTANLARLYRSWADLSDNNAQMRQEMLDKSATEYQMAVTLSPNAAHLWNERANTYLARGETDQAEQSYLQSLSIDPLFEQTYLLLAEFYDNQQQHEKVVELIKKGIETMLASKRIYPTPAMYSYLGVAQARIGDLPGAIESNLTVLQAQPGNIGAMRNLALLYRDSGNHQEAVKWLEETLKLTAADNVNEQVQLNQLAGESYQTLNQIEPAIAKFEAVRQLVPNDINTLKTLSNLYNLQKNDAKVVEVARSLAQLEPDSFEHPLQIAQALQRAGQKAEALTFAQQALALAPEANKAAVNELIEALR